MPTLKFNITPVASEAEPCQASPRRARSASFGSGFSAVARPAEPRGAGVEARLDELLEGQRSLRESLAEMRREMKELLTESPEERTLKRRSVASTKLHYRPTQQSSMGEKVSIDSLDWDVGSANSMNDESMVLALGLPENWPLGLQLRPGIAMSLAASEPTAHHKHANMNRVATQTARASRYTRFLTNDSQKLLQGRNWRDPNSPWQSLIAVIGLLVLTHDVVVIPFALAWQLDMSGYLLVSGFTSLSFWTCEMVVGLLKGYHRDAELILDVRSTVTHYLRTWFVIDAAVLTCDWLSMLLAVQATQGAEGLKLVRMIRLARLLRIFGALRVLRNFEKMKELVHVFFPENVLSVLNVLGLGAMLLWFYHVVACVWFAIGCFGDSDNGLRWILEFNLHKFDGEEITFEDSPILFQYTTVLFWAVTVPAAEQPITNANEKIFAIIYILMRDLLVGTMLSTLSAEMVEMHEQNRLHKKQIRVLERFLHEQKVGGRIALRVLKESRSRLNERQPVGPSEVAVLKTLPSGLASQLSHSICGPSLRSHPCLRLCESIDFAWFARFCNAAVELRMLRPADDLFSAGTVATAAYVLAEGAMVYTQEPGSSTVAAITRQKVVEGSWICESGLWCSWLHVGSVEALTPCKVLAVDGTTLSQMVQTHHTIHLVIAEYGRQYIKRIYAAKPPRSQWPDDLQVPCTDWADMVYSMPASVSRVIGLASLGAASSAFTRSGALMRRRDVVRKAPRLQEEIANSVCVVVLDSSGSVVRIQAVACLELVDFEDRMLWRLARVEEGKSQPALLLPGVRRDRGETDADATDRLLRSRLWPIQSLVHRQGTELRTEEAVSEEFGVPTKYLKSVLQARLREPFDIPACTLYAESFPSTVGNNVSHCSGTLARTVDPGQGAPRVTTASTNSLTSRILRGIRTGGSEGEGMVEEVSVPEALLAKEVYCIFHDDDTGEEGSENCSLYAWLSYRESQQLQAEGGRAVLCKWVSRLRLPRPNVMAV